MKNINKVTLIGSIGNKEVKYTANSNNKIAKASLATTENWKDNGEWKSRTSWHKLACFDNMVAIIESAEIGDFLYVEGKISYSEYEKDGVKRYSTEIVTNTVINLGKNKPKMIEAPPSENDDFPF